MTKYDSALRYSTQVLCGGIGFMTEVSFKFWYSACHILFPFNLCSTADPPNASGIRRPCLELAKVESAGRKIDIIN